LANITQSRATIKALTELKYPRQVIVTQQANITHGNQQVNNVVSKQTEFSDQYAHTRTHAEKNQNEPNELMDSNYEKSNIANQTAQKQPQRLDSRTTSTTIPSHTALETVAAIHRGKNT
jgi:hypothetical protein